MPKNVENVLYQLRSRSQSSMVLTMCKGSVAPSWISTT